MIERETLCDTATLQEHTHDQRELSGQILKRNAMVKRLPPEDIPRPSRQQRLEVVQVRPGPHTINPRGDISLLWWLAIIFMAAVLIGFHVEKVASDTRDKDPQERIQRLERFLQAHPGVFDWKVHNELRHLYITDTPPNPRKSLEHSNVILQHSPMDDYMLHILSEWQLDKNASTARANLLKNARSFLDLPFIAAACFLKIGDLYAMEGNFRMARSFYLKVAEGASADMAEYRVLAEERVKVLKEQPGQVPPAAGIVGLYRGTASIEARGIQRQIPVMLDIKSEVAGVFTGIIKAAASGIVPIQGKDVQGHITASGTVSNRSLSISIQAKRSGKSIRGKYWLTVSNQGQASGEFAVSR